MRAALAAVAAANAGALVALVNRFTTARGTTASDYDQVWVGSLAMRHGRDPYEVAAAFSAWGTQYQPPAFLLNLPLSWLELDTARIAFIALATAILVYGALGRGWSALLVVTSGCFYIAALVTQWSPLLLAGVFLPAASVFWIAKPSIGLALWAGWPRWEAAAAALVLLAVGTALVPGWFSEWRTDVAFAIHLEPVLARPFGWLLLAAVLRWRRPEARFLVAFALVPKTENWYELLPLFLVASAPWQYAWFAAASAVGVWWTLPAMKVAPYPEPMGAMLDRQWPVLFALMYLPALAMVLIRRNEGELPEWMRRVGARLRRASLRAGARA